MKVLQFYQVEKNQQDLTKVIFMNQLFLIM